MRIVVERVEVLVRQALDQTRKAMDVPAIQHFLARAPGGQLLRMLIGPPKPPPVKADPTPVTFSPPTVPVPGPVTTTVPVPAEPPPTVKAPRRAGKPPAAKPPVPTGTRVRVLSGTFQGWTGPLQWSPAKSAYNVPLTGPDGQRTRTTLSPSRRGTTWEVESTAAATPRAAQQKRKEAQA